MGQGVTVTPLQMIMGMSAIANKGLLMRPMLVDRLEDAAGNLVVKYKPQPVRQVASLETIQEMVTALKTVVTPEGTAVQASLDHYTVAGKTGTAQKVEHGQYVQKFFSSFIGFFPADNPEICISVVMDEPRDSHFGGQVAAPVFHAIAERAANYLNLKPDIEPAPSANPILTAAGDQGASLRIVEK
jgi:cell division protein FtsI/penicillin-binding protein 2